MKKSILILLACLLMAGLSACSNSDNNRSGTTGGGSKTPTPNDPPSGNPPPSASCTDPMPAEVRQQSVTIEVPQDFDPTVNPGPTTTTFFTVLIPERCPEQRLPLVLHGHGFAESRVTSMAENGDLPLDLPFHASLDALPAVLPHYGYVVISFDERGHGESIPANGGGYARVLDPLAETRDAQAILDWAYDHAAELGIQTEPGSGIVKDLKVGTLGASYGGGYQMLLAALDPRIDTIVPTSTWHNLLYTLIPGDTVKLAWLGFFSLAIEAQQVIPTPVLATVMNQIGIRNPRASEVRTREDLARFSSDPNAMPRPVTEEEVVDLTYPHGMDYFEAQQAAGEPWGFGESEAVLRPVPALFLQSNRDVIMNMTEAFWNQRYFAQTGADTRLLTNEGGHMNPAVGQVGGDGHCGEVESLAAVLAWYAHYLKGESSAAFNSIPEVCISVADTTGAPDVPAVGVELEAFPVGSLSGQGAIPAELPTLEAAVPIGTFEPVFVPVITIQGNDKVLAGTPRIDELTVTAGEGSVQTPIAFVGTGIRRDGQIILVDDQVTGFVEGTHDSNRGVSHEGELLLPGVGEMLADGDEVGLLFYQQHSQYAPLISVQQAPGVPGIVTLLPFPTPAIPVPFGPVASALNPVVGLLTLPNPYNVTATNVQLPILVPGVYPGSRLTQITEDE